MRFVYLGSPPSVSTMFKFNRKYFAIAVLILVIEIIIAKFVHDQIVRPYIGDLLVVILIYCFVKSFFNTPVIKTAIAVLLFSYLIETLQFFKLVTRLGLQDSAFWKTVIGTSFAWIDLLAYTIGIFLVIIVERIAANRKR
jgi:hypothetical protein